MYRYIICGQDCNKYMPKIINCFDNYYECVNYLNSQGKILNDNFNIHEFINYDNDDLSDTYDLDNNDLDNDNLDNDDINPVIVFNCIGLFKKLFVDGLLIRSDCLHRGSIHIIKIKKGESFDSIYNYLLDYYA